MNRIFKTVWSRTKNMYVVVSEIVNSCGKSKGEHVIDIKAAFAAVLILTSSALGQGVQAKGHEAVELGGAQAQGLRSVALGNGAKAEKQFSTAVGYQADAKGDDSTAYGYKAIATGLSSTALGNGAEAKEKWSTAVGSLAIAEKESSTALGQGSRAQGLSSTAVGYGAKALVDGSIVLGSGSIASIDKGVVGYDPFTGKVSEENSAIWKATQAALSVGSTVDKNNLITRQITGVAAGTKDTDAVNVAQLKVLNTKVDKVAANSTAYTVETKENNDNTTTVTIKSNKAGDKGTTVTVATKDIHITSGTYDKNTKKLTFTTNTNTTFDVDMNDVINAAAEGSVHYLSVNSSETGEGSNYKNDGAKAKDSIVLGVRSSSEGINGVVVGNDNKLTGIKNNQNNSVVIGTGLNVDGVHNIVVGTDYENGDRKETKVKGEQNTVIGNGNLVGYTAVKDPNDDTKWIYTAGDGSDHNVVVGMCNTANGGSVAVGTSLEVEDRGRAFGSGNTIIGSTHGGGQWGLALGSNNTVKGEMSVSVGTGTNAFGDWTVAIGSEAKTNKKLSIAMGYQAETVKGWSAAIGSGAKTGGIASTAVGGLSASATVDYGAAFGSYSVAQRAGGVAGYLANGQSTMVWKSNLGAFSVGDDVTGYSRQITGVAAGSEDTDAVNVAQLKALENKIGTGGTNGKDGKSAYDIWLETQTDKTKTKQDFLDSLKGKDGKDGTGADIDIKGDTDSGVSVTPNTESGKKTYTIGLNTKIKAGDVTIDGTKDKENIAVGDVKINGEKGKGTITGLSNKTWDPNKIESGRAATEDQLQAVTQKMQNCMTDINLHMNGIGASNAALAGLHPLEYDEDDKWDFAASMGNYNGANAFALGAFYRPNERTMISLGGTLGGEEHMINIGLSIKAGQGTDGKVYTSRAAMVKEIKALKEKDEAREALMQKMIAHETEKDAEIKALKEKDAQRDEQIRKLTEMIDKLQHKA